MILRRHLALLGVGMFAIAATRRDNNAGAARGRDVAHFVARNNRQLR